MPPLDKNSFTLAVYDVVKCIPEGRATSYGSIARAIGYPNMSRMVGRVLGQNCLSNKDIPAHRVVNSQGILSGKSAFGDASEMQKLLEDEGIIIMDNRICNWKKIFWNPMEEMSII